jgi:hypothetical protein
MVLEQLLPDRSNNKFLLFLGKPKSYTYNHFVFYLFELSFFIFFLQKYELVDEYKNILNPALK